MNVHGLVLQQILLWTYTVEKRLFVETDGNLASLSMNLTPKGFFLTMKAACQFEMQHYMDHLSVVLERRLKGMLWAAVGDVLTDDMPPEWARYRTEDCLHQLELYLNNFRKLGNKARLSCKAALIRAIIHKPRPALPSQSLGLIEVNNYAWGNNDFMMQISYAWDRVKEVPSSMPPSDPMDSFSPGEDFLVQRLLETHGDQEIKAGKDPSNSEWGRQTGENFLRYESLWDETIDFDTDDLPPIESEPETADPDSEDAKRYWALTARVHPAWRPFLPKILPYEGPKVAYGLHADLTKDYD